MLYGRRQIFRGAGLVALLACILAGPLATPEAPAGLATHSAVLLGPPSGKKLVGLCGKKQGREKFLCYEPLFLDIVASKGVEAAMDILVVAGVLDADVQRDGHVYAHAIGIAAYERSRDVAETFARCSELFQSGCYHGVIQAYLDEALAARDDPGPLDYICERYRGDSSGHWLLFQCVHALGHGLTSYYDHDLPVALHACDRLTEEWDRHSCYGGAFMENVVHATNPHHPTQRSPHAHGSWSHAPASDFVPIKASDPLHPCSVLDDPYLADCYQMQTSIILYHNHGDIGAAAKTCDGAPERMRRACYQSLGRDISSYTLQQPDESIRLCSLGAPDYQPWCYVGLVKNFIDVTAKAESGLSFCPRVPGEANRLKCFEAVGEEIWALTSHNAERDHWCSQIRGDGREACRYGARLRPEAPPGIPVAER